MMGTSRWRTAILLLVVMLLPACRGRSKEERCRAAREKIVVLASGAMERLERLSPQGERLSPDAIRAELAGGIGPEGEFVPRCVATLPDETVDCIVAAGKLSDLGRCTPK